MHLNPFSRKKTNLVAGRPVDAPRAPTGAFVPVAGPPAVSKQLDGEYKNFSTLAQGMKEIEMLINEREKARNAMLDGDMVEETIGSEWAPTVNMALQIFGPSLAPYIPGIMEKLGIAPSAPLEEKAAEAGASPLSGGVQTAPAEPPKDVSMYIKLAAQAHKSPGGMKALKAALPTAYKEMEKAGMNPEEFKQACINISKAIS